VKSVEISVFDSVWVSVWNSGWVSVNIGLKWSIRKERAGI
jgi:hypothetical protein